MTEADVARLRDRLARALPPGVLPDGFRRAAVLVPILVSDEGADLLFTVRSRDLRHHAGQIAFPGGAVESGETPEAAARREAFEEVGLDVPEEGVLGRLPDLPSPAGYVATPVVAVAPRPRAFRIDPREVEETFTVPLEALRSIAPTTETRLFRGAERVLHRYAYGGRDIWGFTGNVLRDFLSYLDPGGRPTVPSGAAP